MGSCGACDQLGHRRRHFRPAFECTPLRERTACSRYVVSAVAIVLIIMCFAEVGSRFTATGGPYLYARVALGPLIAFQVGWLMWLARIAGFAAVCNLGIGYLAYFVPASGADLWRALVIIGAVSSVAIANIIGVRVTAAVTNALTVGKLIPLLLVVLVGLFFVDPQRYSFATPPAFGSFSQAALLLVYAYVGFEGAVIPAGEMRDPGRHLPFALLTGIGVVALLYVLIQMVCIGTLPELASSDRPLSDASLTFLGRTRRVAHCGRRVSVDWRRHERSHVCHAPTTVRNGREPTTSSFVFEDAPTLPHADRRNPADCFGHARPHRVQHVHFSAHDKRRHQADCLRDHVRRVAHIATQLRRAATAFLAPAGPIVALTAVTLSVWLLANSTWAEARLVAIASVIGFVLYVPCALRRDVRQQVKPAAPTAGL